MDPGARGLGGEGVCVCARVRACVSSRPHALVGGDHRSRLTSTGCPDPSAASCEGSPAPSPPLPSPPAPPPAPRSPVCGNRRPSCSKGLELLAVAGASPPAPSLRGRRCPDLRSLHPPAGGGLHGAAGGRGGFLGVMCSAPRGLSLGLRGRAPPLGALPAPPRPPLGTRLPWGHLGFHFSFSLASSQKACSAPHLVAPRLPPTLL